MWMRARGVGLRQGLVEAFDRLDLAIAKAAFVERRHGLEPAPQGVGPLQPGEQRGRFVEGEAAARRRCN